MSHVLIQNKGELPIWGMRLLGLSDKTDEQIGQFGTGLKESIALLTRLGKFPIIYSGTCRIDFSIQEIDSQQEICFKFSEERSSFAKDKWHGMGMHPNFGQRDWQDPWMVYREIFCNAVDESGVENLYHDIISTEPEGIEGSTRIYIPMSPELLSSYSSAHSKLLFLSQPIVLFEQEGIASLFEKRKEPPAQIFHKEVWVQAHKEKGLQSLYDYQLQNIELNESRSADWYYVNAKIGQFLSLMPKRIALPLIQAIIKDHLGEKIQYYETTLMNTAAQYADNLRSKGWREAFYELYGLNAVVCQNEKFYADKLADLGKKPIIILSDGLRNLLASAGVETVNDVLSEDDKTYELLLQPTPKAQGRFDVMWDKFVGAGLADGLHKPGLMLFKQRPGQSVVLFGQYRNNIVSVNLSCLGSEQEEITYVEEICHHISGAMDHTKEFQHFIIESLHKVMVKK